MKFQDFVCLEALSADIKVDVTFRCIIDVRQKDLTLAAKEFRTAIEVAPRNPEVPMTLANVLLRLKMPQEAVKALDHLIDDLGKRTAPALTRRATAKLEVDDRDGARDDLMEALELDSHFGLARQKLRVLNAGG